MLQTIKGAGAGLVALIACPCHLPLTLPLLLALTSGTAVGGWLTANQWLVWVASIVLFIGGLALVVRWMNSTGAHCEIPRQNQVQDQPIPGRIEQHVQRNGHLSAQTTEVSHV